jgi:hypothetical protein
VKAGAGSESCQERRGGNRKLGGEWRGREYCKGFIKVIKENAAVLVKWDEMDGVGMAGQHAEGERERDGGELRWEWG